MEYILKDYRPIELFHYFEEISAIPRGSGNMDGITEYLIEFATSHNFDAVADEVGNVIIYKDATEGYEDAPTIILQGHIDMVCEKVEGCYAGCGADNRYHRWFSRRNGSGFSRYNVRRFRSWLCNGLYI